MIRPTEPQRQPQHEREQRGIEDLAEQHRLRRIHVVTWRDLDHPEAGGSELHITTMARHWAAAGIDVVFRTGSVPGLPSTATRDGYRVHRSGGRLGVLARAPLAELLHADQRDGLIEVWHGINFLAPIWARGPRIGIAHHVHGEQFRHVLPSPAARVAQLLERRWYPRLYRSTPLVTLSASTRAELLAIGHQPALVHVVSPGVSPMFSPGISNLQGMSNLPGQGEQRSATPVVLSVARLMPQKRVGIVIDAIAHLRTMDRHSQLALVIVGDGPDRVALEVRARAANVPVHFAGRVDDATLVKLYRQAWVVVSASIAEGWGMTITEAGACGTPAVATRIAGHVDAIVEGESGLLAETDADLTSALDRVLSDAPLRARLSEGAQQHASHFSWEEAARATFAVLAAQAR